MTFTPLFVEMTLSIGVGMLVGYALTFTNLPTWAKLVYTFGFVFCLAWYI